MFFLMIDSKTLHMTDVRLKGQQFSGEPRGLQSSAAVSLRNMGA